MATGITPLDLTQDERGNTYSIGGVYDLPFLKGVSVFANQSTNFQPQDGTQRLEDADLRTSMEIGALL